MGRLWSGISGIRNGWWASRRISKGMSDRTFILFDDRAADGSGTEDASVLMVCEDNEEALDCRGDYGAMACYSYEVKKTPDQSDELVDEQFEWNWFPGNPTSGPWPS